MGIKHTICMVNNGYYINDTDYIKQFKIIRDNEMQLLNMLVKTDYCIEDDAGDLLFINKNLNPETRNDINKLLIQLLKNNNQLYSSFYNTKNFTTRISENNYNNYLDVFELDVNFLTPTIRQINIKSELIILQDNLNYYEGCVWTFTQDNYPYQGMYAIRSSLLNYLSHGKRNIGNRLIDKVIELAKKNGKTSIIVPWPLESMVIILQKRGFIEVNCSTKSQERLFLEPVALTSNYFIYNL